MQKQSDKNTGKKNIRNDIILLVVFLLIGVVLCGVLYLTSKEGATVEVSVGGEVVAVYPLDKDVSVDIEGKGDGINHLEIKDGEAYVTEANCPDGICIHMGKISYNNESIVCLPNQVVITVIDEENTKGEALIDSVSGGRQ